MTMPTDIAAEAQKLSTDRLVKLYEIDATDLGGSIFRFISSVDERLSVASVTYAGTTAIVTTSTPHALTTGESVRVYNSDQPPFNGDFFVTRISDTVFHYVMAMTPSNNPATSVGAMRLNGSMFFGGHEYIAVAIDVTGFEWNGQGTLPTPTIQIANVNRILMASVISLRDLIGAKFTRIRTFRKHLDDGTDPDDTMIFPKEIYTINQKTAQNKVYIEFQLASAIDQEGVKIPGRQCLRNTCTHRYRAWDATTGVFDYSKATCPYTGIANFTARDVPTPNPDLDRCSKHLSGCKLRFGNSPLPTRATPGIGGR